MIDALYISASGLRSEQKQIDVISNNVANLQTPGFKRGRVNFVEVAAATVAADPTQAADPAQAARLAAESAAGNGSRALSTSTMFTQGELRATRGVYDLAIDGAGFFELSTDDGRSVYTRDGQFRLDAEGALVSIHGPRLAQDIRIPEGAKEVRVDAKGEITAILEGEKERSVLGQIELAAFAAPDLLSSIGDNQFQADDAAGAPTYGRPGETGFGQLQQGQVEMANVEMIDEMSALVLAQRAYQLNARVLQASDQILETINNLRR